MAVRRAGKNDWAWLVDDDGNVQALTLPQLADKSSKEQIEGKIVLLPPAAGGLNRFGMLDGDAEQLGEESARFANDVADRGSSERRIRFWGPEAELPSATQDELRNMHLVRPRIEVAQDGDEDQEVEQWSWYEMRNEGSKTSREPVEWSVHVADVVEHTTNIVGKLRLDDWIAKAIIFAARFHDHGKRRRQFQVVLGNSRFSQHNWAKSGRCGPRLAETYRHEFGSLLDIRAESEFAQLTDDQRELVLHLIAAHHGRARPHLPVAEAFDPAPTIGADASTVAAEVPRRFARLQRQYGRWGLAYLESLLRAADWAASANPSAIIGG